MNPVLLTTSRIIENSQYVRIDEDAIKSAAKMFCDEVLEVPSWDAPVFPENNDESTIDFFLLGNSINFAYTDFYTKEKYATDFKGKEWVGAFGMWASLKRAIEAGLPILDGNYLKNFTRDDAQKFFAPKSNIPLLDERVRIFNEVGAILCDRYDGRFHNFIKSCPNRLFDGGKGMIDRLVQEFPAYEDSAQYNGTLVRFDKKAQLSAAKLYARLNKTGLFDVEDIDELTVFADYVLPKALRSLGILVYSASLAKRVDEQTLISKDSQEELELRASTIHSAKRLTDKVNELRGEKSVNALHIDYRLWSQARKTKEPHHLTITTAY